MACHRFGQEGHPGCAQALRAQESSEHGKPNFDHSNKKAEHQAQNMTKMNSIVSISQQPLAEAAQGIDTLEAMTRHTCSHRISAAVESLVVKEFLGGNRFLKRKPITLRKPTFQRHQQQNPCDLGEKKLYQRPAYAILGAQLRSFSDELLPTSSEKRRKEKGFCHRLQRFYLLLALIDYGEIDDNIAKTASFFRPCSSPVHSTALSVDNTGRLNATDS
ncbi:hypothetical protein BT63DRAFT_420038 [Microthyrium microscopicum]|uniref:Uncharacterized protein n=1 Tax=Microthyrium microscopicum TaxID=703497 RepID=A0A6A6USK3_9PEZI|nr:hypothetical protein BT63DRAFT_420038 [Microthyrium microscopicum]